MLLMIPGPVEVSPAVREAFSVAPPSHLAPDVIEAHGHALEQMRGVWLASTESQPFIIPGSGTLAMEIAVANLVQPEDRAVVVNTGYFSDRIAEMLRRRGAAVQQVRAEPGKVPSAHRIEQAIRDASPDVVFATHVDTSTGVRVDPERIAQIAADHDALSVFDGVCATAAERFEMENWGADVYLTASQKAIGLPPGLALMVASPEAMARRNAARAAVPMALDWLQWLPIMQAYEDRRPSYFSTPATNHILALAVSLDEILADGMQRCFERHEKAGAAMRAAWEALGLELLCEPEHAANTLSAVRYPDDVGPELLGAVKKQGVVVAGGLYQGLKQSYFRVGHMGYSTNDQTHLTRAVEAIGRALVECGHEADVDAALEALDRHLP
jgi:alanine-glyoxylate transaminase/serine-glyoxylate transaminase/serine-pyruvate transaminase